MGSPTTVFQPHTVYKGARGDEYAAQSQFFLTLALSTFWTHRLSNLQTRQCNNPNYPIFYVHKSLWYPGNPSHVLPVHACQKPQLWMGSLTTAFLPYTAKPYIPHRRWTSKGWCTLSTERPISFGWYWRELDNKRWESVNYTLIETPRKTQGGYL